MNLNYNDLVHILKQIKIAENHVPGQPILDAQGNPLGNLVPYGLRTVSGQFNDLTDQYDGAAHTIMPRLLTPEFITAPNTSIDFDGNGPAPATPITSTPITLDMNGPAPGGNTQFSTDYNQTSGYVIDAAPRTISNLISDQSLGNDVAILGALNALGVANPHAALVAIVTARDAVPAAQANLATALSNQTAANLALTAATLANAGLAEALSDASAAKQTADANLAAAISAQSLAVGTLSAAQTELLVANAAYAPAAASVNDAALAYAIADQAVTDAGEMASQELLDARVAAQLALSDAEAVAAPLQAAAEGATIAVAVAQNEADGAQDSLTEAQLAADAAASDVAAVQAQIDAAPDLAAAQSAATAANAAVATATLANASAPIALQAALDTYGVTVENDTVFIPNVMPDLGDTAPYNSFLTLFGQFFDHGLDLVSKGGSGTVYVPLQPDDPLYVAGSPTNFMVLTRATNQPGADGVLGTADDVREHNNETTPWIDLNQVYTSHESHQVFLREYKLDASGKPVATGHMLEGAFGGPPTWADIKAQAANMLGIQLADADVGRVPLVASDLYGNFIPGTNGFVQLVTATGLVEGNPAAPVTASTALAAGNAFLNDIAHNAAPGAGKVADGDTITNTAAEVQPAGTYDNELLDKHFIVGDGRGNENIGLTAVHHVFHSEHNHRVEQIKEELLASNDIAFINEWLSADIETIPTDTRNLEWDGERLFQAARFSTEMVYQHLVFEEFARLVSPEVDPFVFSNTVDIDAGIMAEFAHVVYRFGHSMLNETVDRIAADGQTTDNIGLIEAFLNPVEYVASGVDSSEAAGAIIRGMSRQVGNEIDELLTEALRNNLVGLPLDLGALNIARGRDTGVPSLNNARAQMFEQTQNTQLKPYDSWFDFALAIKTPASIVNFIAAYGTHSAITSAISMEAKRDAALALVTGVSSDANLLALVADRVDYLNSTGAWATAETGLNNVDFWIGGLAEKKPPFGGLLGTTFNFVFEVQMEKLQAGDRFYYLSRTQGMNLLNELEGDSFAELVMRNTDLGNPNSTHLPSSLFLTPAYTLELNLARQKGVDPTHENPILNAISPMVVRNDPATAGPDTNYLRFTGGDHVVLGGTEQNDTLIGGEGDDTLWGDGGNDFLEGGFGVDHLFGGAGNDILTDSANDAGAADVFHGEAGDDVISSGNGLDLIFAGDGSDFVYGGQDSKTITAGEGNDFVSGPTGGSMIAGNEGDDWLEGGVGSSGLDTLAGENSELFFNSPIIGHDVLNGRDGDTDYDAESGDDIMVQGVGIQRNNGMAGFDWAIHKGDAVAADSDLGIPIFVNQQANILRDRFDLTEGLSGWKFNDKLVGREVVIGAYDEAAAAAAQFDPTAPFQSYSNALNVDGVARIAGLDQLVSHLERVTFTVAGKEETVVVFDETAVVRDADGIAITMFDTAADILLGGGGSDILQGKAGNDIIDGDKWLNVRIRINDATGAEIGSAEEMSGTVTGLDGQPLFGDRSLSALMFDRTLTPSQLSIVREILKDDGLDANGVSDVDVAVFSGNIADYDISRTGSVLGGDLTWTVAHTRGTATDGTDTIRNVEILDFADVDFNSSGVNALPVGTVVIVGDAAEDQMLIADTSGISDPDSPDGIAFTFQWLRDGVAIAGATGETFDLSDADVGAQISVQVSYVDDAFTPESLTSAQTAPVTPVNDLPDGVVTVDNAAPDLGRLLTASFAITDVDGIAPLAINIQWQSSFDGGLTWDDIAGATGTTYTTAIPGAQLRAEARYTDLQGFSNSLASAATAAVLPYHVVTGTPNPDSLAGQATLPNLISGLESNDLLVGGAGNDTLDGGLGNDTMVGGDGDDTYVFNGGADAATEFGNQGNDTVMLSAFTTYTLGANLENVVYSGAANATLTGNGLSNVIVGAAGNDSMAGGQGNDTLIGNLGNDTLHGGTGGDSLVGGAGDDTYYADNAGDVIVELAGQGVDTVIVTDLTPFTLAAEVDNLTFVGNANMTGFGNTLGNVMRGANGNDNLSGLDGNDLLQGNNGNDVLSGGIGADTLQGGAGGDELNGGIGNDVLNGGTGNDVFVFGPGFGNDIVQGFAHTPFLGLPIFGQDLLDISALGVTAANFASQVTITDIGTSVLIGVGGGTIELQGIANTNVISASDFLLA